MSPKRVEHAVGLVDGVEQSPYLTAEQCAARLHKSLRAFYRFIESGRGVTMPRLYCGRTLLFDPRAVDLWLRSQGRSVKAVSERRLSRVHTGDECAGEPECL